MPRRGTEEERRAARHYRLRGYRILGANVWAGGYELDLIARRGRRLVFCEVKGKSGPGFGDPLEMVGRGEATAAPPGSRGLARAQSRVPGAGVPFRGGRGARAHARARRGLTLRQHVSAAEQATIRLAGRHYPQRARSSERLRPGRVGHGDRQSQGGRNFRLNSEPDHIQPERNDRKHYVDHTNQVRDPGPHLGHHRRARRALRRARRPLLRLGRGLSSSPGSRSSSTSSCSGSRRSSR